MPRCSCAPSMPQRGEQPASPCRHTHPEHAALAGQARWQAVAPAVQLAPYACQHAPRIAARRRRGRGAALAGHPRKWAAAVGPAPCMGAVWGGGMSLPAAAAGSSRRRSSAQLKQRALPPLTAVLPPPAPLQQRGGRGQAGCRHVGPRAQPERVAPAVLRRDEQPDVDGCSRSGAQAERGQRLSWVPSLGHLKLACTSDRRRCLLPSAPPGCSHLIDQPALNSSSPQAAHLLLHTALPRAPQLSSGRHRRRPAAPTRATSAGRRRWRRRGHRR